MVTLLHLVPTADWDASVIDGAYRPPSLEAEGFVHLSTPDQVEATRARYYAEVDDLLVVSVDAAAVGDALVWEDSSGHGTFPHHYGRLPLSAVTDVRPYEDREHRR